MAAPGLAMAGVATWIAVTSSLAPFSHLLALQPILHTANPVTCPTHSSNPLGTVKQREKIRHTLVNQIVDEGKFLLQKYSK